MQLQVPCPQSRVPGVQTWLQSAVLQLGAFPFMTHDVGWQHEEETQSASTEQKSSERGISFFSEKKYMTLPNIKSKMIIPIVRESSFFLMPLIFMPLIARGAI